MPSGPASGSLPAGTADSTKASSRPPALPRGCLAARRAGHFNQSTITSEHPDHPHANFAQTADRARRDHDRAGRGAHRRMGAADGERDRTSRASTGLCWPSGPRFWCWCWWAWSLYLLISIKEIRLNRRQSNFIDSVTHELKSPIASLKLYLQTLSRRNVDEQRQADFYRFMLDDVERLDSLINHLLDAARLDQQPVEARKRRRAGRSPSLLRQHRLPALSPVARDCPVERRAGAGPRPTDGPGNDLPQPDRQRDQIRRP